MKTGERVETYVKGFDEQIGGGIPRGHVVLIAGTPGTMKSSLAYSILYNNATSNGTKSLYISLEQSRDNLLDHMNSLGMRDKDVSGAVDIIDLGLLRKKMRLEAGKIWIDVFKMYTQKLKATFDYKLLVLDSLDASNSWPDSRTTVQSSSNYSSG